MNRIICIKWGDKYSADYVNRLQKMLERNTSVPFKLICFTDDSAGIFEEIETHPLPELGCEIPKTVPGKFPKIALWGDQLPIANGPVLFIDLDTVIVDNIDDYFTIGKPEDVYLAKNWAKPFSGLGQTSIFRFSVGHHTYILKNLQENTKELAEKFRYEQHYVTKNVTPKVKFWPNNWTRHFRLHCLGAWPLRYLKSPTKPSGAKIITFPGLPDPEDAIIGRMSNNYPKVSSPWQHIKWSLFHPNAKNRRFITLKKYVPKSEWLKKAWDVL